MKRSLQAGFLTRSQAPSDAKEEIRPASHTAKYVAPSARECVANAITEDEKK
jgi:hypothetical protein